MSSLSTALAKRLTVDFAVKEGKLEVSFDEDDADFAYHDPGGGRALLELLPTPSWHSMQYRG